VKYRRITDSRTSCPARPRPLLMSHRRLSFSWSISSTYKSGSGTLYCFAILCKTQAAFTINAGRIIKGKLYYTLLIMINNFCSNLYIFYIFISLVVTANTCKLWFVMQCSFFFQTPPLTFEHSDATLNNAARLYMHFSISSGWCTNGLV